MADQIVETPAQPQQQAQTESPTAQHENLNDVLGDMTTALIEGLQGKETPVEQATATQSTDATTEKPKDEQAPAQPEHIAAFMARASKRERELNARIKELSTGHEPVKEKAARFDAINTAIEAKDRMALLRALNQDPAEFVVDVLGAINVEEKPLTMEDMKRIAREQVEAEYKARSEAETKARTEAEAKAKAETDEAFTGYFKVIAEVAAKHEEDFPLVTAPGMLPRFADDIKAWSLSRIKETGAAPTVKEILTQLEGELSANMFARGRKKYASQAQTTQAQSFTLTPRLTSTETGTRNPERRAPASLAEELDEMVNNLTVSA